MKAVVLILVLLGVFILAGASWASADEPEAAVAIDDSEYVDITTLHFAELDSPVSGVASNK